MANRLDIILFGATGFTGKHCIEKLYKLCKTNGRSLTWGIAGRSENKLKEVLNEFKDVIPVDVLNSIPIVIADIKDYDSLKRMTAGARIIINCCGPYRFVGEPVIKACIETGTHQVDVTGEPQYIEGIELNYHKQAQEKGIYIVSACGFDSVPADLGVVFLQKNFSGTLNSVETYLEGGEEPPTTPGPAGNYTTWESAVHSLANHHELAEVRKKAQKTRLPQFTPKLKPRFPVHKNDLINSWCLPFMGSDRSIILRTQRYLYETKKIRPAQAQTYFGVTSFFYLIVTIVFGGMFLALTKFSFGCKLLLDYPKFFSAGYFSHESPSEEKIKKTKFSITFRGEGWKDKLSAPEDNFTTPPNKTVITRVSGKDAGYGLTAAAVTLAAIIILTEPTKLADKGGVLPPGATFHDTTYIEQLQQNGLAFEILSDK